MKATTTNLRSRLERLVGKPMGITVTVWDVIAGEASPDELNGIQREMWEKLTNSQARDAPDQIEATIALAGQPYPSQPEGEM